MQFARYISVVLASTIKFVGGPLSGLALGLSWVETTLCTVFGMMLSVLVVTYAGAALQALLDRYRPRQSRLFTSRTRLAVKIWKRFGMAGIAFLTPLLLTPIGGTALAVSFRVNRGRLFGYMLVSGIGWAVIQTLLVYQLPRLRELLGW